MKPAPVNRRRRKGEKKRTMTQEELNVKLTGVDARSKSNTHRIDKLESRADALESLASSVRVLATKQESMDSDVKEIKADVKTLTEKPAKWWDCLIDKLIWTLTAAVAGFLLARIGL